MSEKLFLSATYQTGKNPLNAKSFFLLKKHSKRLCRKLAMKNKEISTDTCESISALPPVNFDKITYSPNNLIPHYTDYYKLNQSSSNEEKSSFDLKLYSQIEKIIEKSIDYRRHVWMNDCCSLVLNEVWEVLSMNVCRDYDDLFAWQVNGCLNKRQTWSVAKPFLYILAMHELWLTKDSIIEDKPIKFYLDQVNLYTPKNFDMKYHWEVTLAWALGSSLNIPAVDLLSQIWVKKYINFLNELRIDIWKESPGKLDNESDLYNPDILWLSSALGTYELSPLEFARLWKIFFQNYKTYSNQIDEVFKILSDNKNRVYSFNLDNYLDKKWWAVKTWTSRHFVDGWTCWANREKKKIVCVWWWNYNWSAMKKSGIETAWYLWNIIVDNL